MDSSTKKFKATGDTTLHDLKISYTLKPKQLDALENNRHNLWAVSIRHERGEDN